MSKKRDARLAKLVADEVGKSALSQAPMQVVGGTVTDGMRAYGLNAGQGEQVRPLARYLETFGGSFSPGVPFTPYAINEVDPQTGRPYPRKWDYPLSWNLEISQKLAGWNVLKAKAQTCDIAARCITIRAIDTAKKDLKFTISDEAIQTIMGDNNVGQSEAAKIARQENLVQITKLQEFWENPYPQSDRGWDEFVTEMMWQILVYDGLPIMPFFNLGAKCIGFDIIDAATIKILLNNQGMVPSPPSPAYQQILFGFPRGEFIGPEIMGDSTFMAGEYNIQERDQLSYFVMNRRTWTPYGFSPLEQALPAINLYENRQEWLNSEYTAGTMAKVYLKATGSEEISSVNFADWQRVFNDPLSGMTAQRNQTQVIPFDPIFAPQMDERYKAEMDESIRKWVGTAFGISPSQLGIIPRAGLGGGKGAQEGEQDNAETVSGRPTENFIVGIVNTLSRRYLGTTRAVTAVLDESTSTKSELDEANAGKIYTGFGGMTLNEWRDEQGMSPLTFPEADQPFLATPTGPIFFTGTLDAQLNPPEPPAPVIMQGNYGTANEPGAASGSGDQGQAKENQEGSQSQESESPARSGKSQTASAGLKDKEKAAYLKFSAKPRNREFEFLHHSDDEILTLKAGLAPHTKVSVTKRDLSQLPGVPKVDSLAQKHRNAILTALKVGGAAAAIRQAIAATKDVTQAELISSTVQQAIEQNVTQDVPKLSGAIQALYNDAAQVSPDGFEPLETVGPRLQGMLDQADTWAGQVSGTTLSRLRTAITDGVANGDPYSSISTAVNAVIDDPQRADTIAVTEASRAYNQGAVDTFEANGSTQFWWIAYDGACPECQDQEDSNPHDIGDEVPPIHPNDRCDISDVDPDS